MLRPSPRQSAAGSDIAYDAKQILLSEEGSVPDAKWHTVSLLLKARKALGTSPLDLSGSISLHREVTATNAIGYLAQRGFDADSLVRLGFSSSITLVIADTLSRLWMSASEGKALSDGARSILVSWGPLFEQHVVKETSTPIKDGSLLAAAMTGEFATRLYSWLLTVDLVDVVNWTNPPSGAADSGITVDPEIRLDALWTIERLTKTYLTDWATDSLLREYKWLTGQLVPAVPVDQMRLRATNIDYISAEIARRTVEGKTDDYSFQFTMFDQAVDYLQAGRREAAAGLLDAARILHPNNAVFHNNYGFCLIPDRAEEALEALREAERIDPFDWVNLTNQSVVLWLTGHPRESLQYAERALNPESKRAEHAYLWDFITSGESDGADVELRHVRVAEFLAAFGLKVAKQLQDPALIERWQARVRTSEAKDNEVRA